jgi:carboxylesterase type B
MYFYIRKPPPCSQAFADLISKDGGFLQLGTANGGTPVPLLESRLVRAIIIKPAYRLNLFGFLAIPSASPSSPSANFGLHDLRLALEWTLRAAPSLAGDPGRVTVGGYSAGAHAAFHLLANDLNRPPSERLISAVVMHSNGPGARPRTLTETAAQFAELRTALNIPAGAGAAETLRLLRDAPAPALLAAAARMQRHQFRVTADDVFVRTSLFASLSDGRFARALADAGVRLFVGECADEHHVYATYRPPVDRTFAGVFARLRADYPDGAVAGLARHYAPGGRLPAAWKGWGEGFGRVYADVQIHGTQRGFLAALERGGAGGLVSRYRIEWRAKCVDERFPRAWGATHGADNYLWWFGDGLDLTSEEQVVVRRAFLEDMGRFLNGEEIAWGTKGVREARRLKADGQVDIWRDELWDEGLAVWEALRKGDDLVGKPRL